MSGKSIVIEQKLLLLGYEVNRSVLLAENEKIRTILAKLEKFFFFQAEDGIRDGHVNGVQTCALPISPRDHRARLCRRRSVNRFGWAHVRAHERWKAVVLGKKRRGATRQWYEHRRVRSRPGARPWRSEERRVGKECRSRWATSQ